MPRKPSRAELERYVADLALAYGWRCHHTRCPGLTHDGYADGFPPDVLLRDGRLVFVVASPLTLPEAAWARELAAVTTVEMHVIQHGDLGPLARALGPQAEAMAVGDAAKRERALAPRRQRREPAPSPKPRAPPREVSAQARRPPPGNGAGRQKPNQAHSDQEEACEGQTRS